MMVTTPFRLGVIIFGSVQFLSKKITKIKFWKTEKFEPEPNRNQFKPTGFSSVRFGFFNIKTKKTYIQTDQVFLTIFSTASPASLLFFPTNPTISKAQLLNKQQILNM